MNRTLLTFTAFLSLQISTLKKILLQFSSIDKENYVWLPTQSGQNRKGLSKAFGFLLVLLFTASFANAATRTASVSGNWDNTATWGGSAVPTSSDDVIINNGITVTVNVNAVCKSLNISGILRIGNNNTNRSVTVSGNVTVNGGGTFNSAGDGGNTLLISGNVVNDGTFNMNNGTADAEVTFNGSSSQTISGAGATMDFNSITLTNASPLVINRGITVNANWTNNAKTVSGSGVVTFTGTSTIGGTTVTAFPNLINTGTVTQRVNTTVTGNFTINSGTYIVNNASSYSFTILGNYNQTGGIFDFNAGTSGTSNVYLAGNLTNSAVATNSIYTSGVGAPNGTLTFNGVGTQVFNITTSQGATWVKYIVNSGSTLQLASNLTLTRENPAASGPFVGEITVNGTIDLGSFQISESGGTNTAGYVAKFTLNSGATLITANAGGIDGSVSSTNITRTFSTAANYNFNGTVAQITSAGMPATVNSLAIANALGVTLSKATTVTNNFSIGSGAVANLGTGLTHAANTLTLGVNGQNLGSWGSTTSAATYKNDTYFSATNGIINVATSSCTAAGYWTGTTSTDWNTASNWCGNAVPTAATNVVIQSGTPFQPTITGTTALANNLTINASATLTLTNNLNIRGNFISNGTFAAAATSTTNFDGAAQTVAGVTYGNLTLSNSGVKTLGAISVAANLTLNGTATATTTANLAVGGNLAVGAGTTLTTGNNFTLGVTGTTGVTGTGSLVLGGTGAKTFTGLVSVAGTWNNAGNSPVTFRGGINYTGISFITGTGLQTFDTNAQSLTGGTLTMPNITVTGVTLTNSGNLYVSTALSGTGAIINASPAGNTLVIQGASSIATITNNATANIEGSGAISSATFTNAGTVNLSGSGTITSFNNSTAASVLNISALTVPTISTLTANFAGNTVNYNGGGAQTIKANTYSNLTLSNSGTKTLGGAVTTDGALTLNNTTSLAMSTHLLTLNGNLTNNGSGTITGSTGGVTIAGTAAQNIAGFTTTGTVTVAKTSGMATLTGIVSGGTITVPSGPFLNLGAGFTHSAGTLTLGGSATAAGSWGGISSGATNINAAFFATATGRINVTTSSCVSNLIINGDFASGTTGWTNAPSQGTYAEVHSENTYFSTGNGDNTAELDSAASLGQTITVVPGISYTVSFLYARRATAGTPATVAVDVKITGGSSPASAIFTTSSSTVPQIGSFTFTPTGSSVGIEFYNSLHGGLTLGTIIDNIVLIPTSQVTPFATTVPKGVFKTLTSCAGVPVQLNVENVPASGVTYAWTGSAGAVFSSTIIQNPTVTFTGSGIQEARVIATTTGGCSSSQSITFVTVNTAPAITTQPSTPTATCSGSGTQSMTVAATGTGLTYDWQLGGVSVANGGVISGQGTATLTLTNPTAVNAGSYTVVVSGICTPSVTSTARTVNVNAAPAITAQPSTPTATCSGSGTQSMTVAATGTGLTYDWQLGGVSVANGGVISGQGTATLTLTNPTAANAGSYTVVVSGTCTPSVTSTARTVTVNPLPNNVTNGFSATIMCAGGSPQLTFDADDSTFTLAGYSITYKNETNSQSYTVAIGTSTPFTFPAGGSPTANTGYTLVSITNGNGCTNSIVASFLDSGANLIVRPTPTLTGATQPTFACDGSGATIDLSGLLASSTSTITYTINGGSTQTVTGVVADGSGVASFTTGVLTTANDGQTLQITGVTTTSATPNCMAGFTQNVTLSVKSDSGIISINGELRPTGNVTYCPSNVATFSIPAVSGAVYTWIVPTGWKTEGGVAITMPITSSSNELKVITGTNAESGPIIVTIDSFCPSSLLVALSGTTPTAPTVTKTPLTCAVPTGTITVDTPAPSSGTVYTLTGTNPVRTPVNNTTGEFAGLAAGDYVVTYQQGSGCVSASTSTITIQALFTKTWDGSSWSPAGGPPSLNDYVVFNGDYNLSDSIDACSCTVNATKHVTIASGKVLTVVNDLKVDGTLTFKNGASLIQKNENPNPSTLKIVYERTTSTVKDFDYVYWSSPVEGQKLGVLSPSSDKYWSWSDYYWVPAVAGETMIEGKGYIARVPRYVTSQTVEFKGTPNNGDVTIAAQGNAMSNLIGNPYPSAIDAEDFMVENQDIIPTGGMLAFWTHTTKRTLSGDKTEYVYEADDYGFFNLAGGIATNYTPLSPGGSAPDGTIAAGQSFMVGSETAIKNIFKFTNSMRIGDDVAGSQNGHFFRQTNTKKTAKKEKNRIWLNLTNDGGAFKQLLVGYITGATNGADKLFDGTSRNSNAYVDFYSVMDSEKYTIQGRGLPFNEEDQVPLGYKSTIEGTFQIGIDRTDGFMAKQAVYLEDKTANIIHDLTKGTYSFVTAKGEFQDRFVLRYNSTKLGTGDFDAKGKGVVVSVKNSQIKINSFDSTVTSLKVYDLKGSLLYQKDKVGKNEFTIDHFNSSSQFLIVMVQLEDGKWISEEIIFHD